MTGIVWDLQTIGSSPTVAFWDEICMKCVGMCSGDRVGAMAAMACFGSASSAHSEGGASTKHLAGTVWHPRPFSLVPVIDRSGEESSFRVECLDPGSCDRRSDVGNDRYVNCAGYGYSNWVSIFSRKRMALQRMQETCHDCVAPCRMDQALGSAIVGDIPVPRVGSLPHIVS